MIIGKDFEAYIANKPGKLEGILNLAADIIKSAAKRGVQPIKKRLPSKETLLFEGLLEGLILIPGSEQVLAGAHGAMDMQNEKFSWKALLGISTFGAARNAYMFSLLKLAGFAEDLSLPKVAAVTTMLIPLSYVIGSSLEEGYWIKLDVEFYTEQHGSLAKGIYSTLEEEKKMIMSHMR